MSAVSESIGPQLERMQEQLVLAGDVRLSRAMARLRATWGKARLEEAKRTEAERVEAAKSIATLGIATLVVELPIRTVNEKNHHEHWGKKKRLRGDIRTVVRMAMSGHANRQGLKVKPPCHVVLTRLAPLPLDTGGNLEMALSATRDGIADWLGINDRSPTVTWECGQEKHARHGVRIEVRT